MKTSDLTLSIIIVFIFIFLYIFNLVVVGMQRIKDNWPVYRCQPLVMPFASFFGHDTGKNYAYCIQSMQKGFMDDLLKPLNFNVNILGDITSELTGTFNNFREFTKYFRFSMMDAFSNIFATLFNLMIEVQRTVINIKDMVGKVIGIMTTTLYVLDGSVMTMSSAWSGPPGQLVRALCFHPETQLDLKNGNKVSMKDVELNSILKNGTRVLSVMKLSNLDENGTIIEKMYRVKRNIKNNNDNDNDDDYILVSGSHLIYNPDSKQFVQVKDLPNSEISQVDCDVLSCLITSNHTIPIGDWIFHDWEDNNGSQSKSI
jgi:hypothetical protein